jgi:DNA-binding beta-propeller fold protein YncE
MSIALFLAVVASLAGCGPKIVETNYAQRYPAYPKEPRIAYLKSYYGAGDEDFQGILGKLLGSAKSDLMGAPYQAVWLKDTLYVTLQTEKSIAVIDTSKSKFTEIKNLGDVLFVSVAGLAVSSAGDIYLCDWVAHSIYVAYEDDGDFVLKKTMGADQNLLQPRGIALDEKRDRLYVVDTGSRSLKAFTMAGEYLFEFGSKPGDSAEEPEEPYDYFGIAVDKRNGKIVASDTANFKIRVFDDQGKLVRAFGEASDGPLGFGMLRGVAVNSEGHIYASDAFTHTVSLFNDEGYSLMIIGGYGTGPGRFKLPLGLSFDEADRLFVADSMNGRVQVYQYLSDQWKKDHPEEYAKYKAEPPATAEVIKKKETSVPIKHQ